MGQTWLKAAAVHIVVVGALFFPYLFQGRVFFEAGALHHAMPWSPQPPADSRMQPKTLDDLGYYGPHARFYSRELEAGRFSLWNPDIGCGVPAHATRQSPIFSPLYLPMLLLLSDIEYLHGSAMLRLLLAGLFFRRGSTSETAA